MTSEFEYHIQQGQIFLNHKQIHPAIEHFKQALRQRETPELIQLLASCYMYLKQFKIACTYWENLFDLSSSIAPYIQCGLCYKLLKNWQQAEKTYLSGLSKNPNSGKLYNELALLHYEQHQMDKAFQTIKKAISLSPQEALFHSNLGVFYQHHGNYKEAQNCFHKAIELKPDLLIAHLNFAKIETQHTLIEKHLKQALIINPNHQETLQEYGDFLLNQNKISTAQNYYKQALFQNPEDPVTLNSLAIAYQRQGELELSGKILKKILYYPQYHSNFLLLQRAFSDYCKKQSFKAFVEWETRHSLPLCQSNPRIDFSAEKPLKVGYISPDFGQHSVAKIFKGLFKNHSPNIEIFAFSDKIFPDEKTQEFKSLCHFWKDTFHFTNEALIKEIQDNHIDILVDLTGHTAYNRLQVFSAKPAPLQFTGLGLCETTGIQNIDYLLTDPFVTPPDSSLFIREKVAYISSFFYWEAPPYQRELPPHPHTKNGYITFGNGNALFKMNESVIICWARILKQLKTAKLHLKSDSLSDDKTCQQIVGKFKEQGITEKQLIFSPASSHQEHLSFYNQVDIALDPFPYNGGMSACEALWKGVPMIALKGGTNTGYSILKHTNLTQWIANDIEEYIQLAIEVAKHPFPAKSLIRQSLLQSVLCNGKKFATSIENMYRMAWRIKSHEAHSQFSVF